MLEAEFQKREHRHGTRQRPDIILHRPADTLGTPVYQRNIAVFALKRKASPNKALADFGKMNEMFEELRYLLGIFINIDSEHTQLEFYTGTFRQRVHGFSVRLAQGGALIIHDYWTRGRMRTVEMLPT